MLQSILELAHEFTPVGHRKAPVTMHLVMFKVPNIGAFSVCQLELSLTFLTPILEHSTVLVASFACVLARAVILAFFIELTLVDLRTVFVSHDTTEAVRVLELSREFVASLVGQNTAVFHSVFESSDVDLWSLFVPESAFDFLTFFPRANVGTRLVFECAPAVLQTFLPIALINRIGRIELEDALARWKHHFVKGPEVDPVRRPKLAHDEHIVFPDTVDIIPIQFLVDPFALPFALREVSAVLVATFVLEHSVALLEHCLYSEWPSVLFPRWVAQDAFARVSLQKVPLKEVAIPEQQNAHAMEMIIFEPASVLHNVPASLVDRDQLAGLSVLDIHLEGACILGH